MITKTATAQRKVEAHPAREQLPAAQEERDRVLRDDGQDRRAPFPRKYVYLVSRFFLSSVKSVCMFVLAR